MKTFHPLENLSARKKPYFIHLEIGFIGTLLVLIGLFSIEVNYKPAIILQNDMDFGDIIELPDITVQKVTPPKPAVPVITFEKPESEIIEDEPIDFTSDNFEIGLPIELPKEAVDEPTEFRVVEKLPEITGGYAQLYKHLSYPKIAQEVGIQGRVILEFLVNEQGMISQIKVVRGIGGGCDEAAITAVKKVKFKPGLQRGRPVPVRFTLPITFKLK